VLERLEHVPDHGTAAHIQATCRRTPKFPQLIEYIAGRKRQKFVPHGEARIAGDGATSRPLEALNTVTN